MPISAADIPAIDRFPSVAHDKLRYGDTDRQGHVNNAVLSTFLETGRVELLMDPLAPINDAGAAFVIANLNLSFIAEINWPGQVDVGTGVLKIGNSSVHLLQAVFQDGSVVAAAETVLVQMNDQTRKSQPLSARAKSALEDYLMPEAAER